jgi:hypothetical protein
MSLLQTPPVLSSPTSQTVPPDAIRCSPVGLGQTLSRLQAEGYHVLIIGSPRHEGTRRLLDDLSDCEVIESADAVKCYASARLAVVAPRPAPARTVSVIRRVIAARNPGAVIVDLPPSPADAGDECRPWSSAQWCVYYRANAAALRPLPWEHGAALSKAERAALAGSLQDFQLGESSEGHRLVDRAAAYAAATGDAEYLDAIRLFIAEEQRHAGDLGRYLHAAGIPLLRRTRLDSVFRWLRRRAGLELCVSVLLTAEVIGKVYYTAVLRATRCQLLRRLCEQLLCDEVQHLRFQAERLALLRQGRSRWRVRWAHACHRVLLAGTCLAVWCKHRRAFRAGGFSFRAFWRTTWRTMQTALRQMNPQ